MKQGGVWAIFESASSFFFLPQSLSASQSSSLNKGGVEGWRTPWLWLWLEVIYDHKLHFYRVTCSSFATCGERCCMTGLITLFAGNVNLWEAGALCCLQDESELLQSSVRARTRCMTALVFKPAAVFQKPLGQICLPHSAARRPPHLSRLSLSAVCGRYCLRLPLASSVRRLLCAHSAPSHPC